MSNFLDMTSRSLSLLNVAVHPRGSPLKYGLTKSLKSCSEESSCSPQALNWIFSKQITGAPSTKKSVSMLRKPRGGSHLITTKSNGEGEAFTRSPERKSSRELRRERRVSPSTSMRPHKVFQERPFKKAKATAPTLQLELRL